MMATVPLLLVLVVLWPVSDVTGCNFPDFLASDGGGVAEDGTAARGREWRTHWRQHSVLQQHDDDDDPSSMSTTSAEVFFDGGLMRWVEEQAATLARRRQTAGGTSNSSLDARRGHGQRHAHHHHSRSSFTRRCQQVVAGPDHGRARYLATHRQLGDSQTRYICLEFVLRSSTVLQVGLTVVNAEPLGQVAIALAYRGNVA